MRRSQASAVVLASGSPHKLAEFRRLFLGSPVRTVPPSDFAGPLRVDETGATFLQNARLKAAAYARACQAWSLADDSGLEVDALGGAPGVRSARYAGPNASDDARNAKLLAALADVPEARRTARFRCAVALAAPDGSIVYTAVRSCEGRIAHAPRGGQGFGYDPLFIVGAGDRTMAELTPDEKNRVSHRGLAARAARCFLEARLATTPSN
ncbi:MAG: RdgB/HAM1 family non-canonical purine NTP pyrophosphatase [Chloroflexi bacterium]|nr:RdgB/HAM1 family non-canonical purine NTP pyrophosphatase [Chloroflexota bacterium]